jgi:cytochrome P450
MDRHDSTATQDTVRTADDRLAEYFDGVIQDRVQTPRADLSGRLVQRHVSTGELTPRQAASLLHVLLNGGFDTTRNMIAMATILLLDHSDQLEGLRKDPTGWPEAVEELLRYLSVVQYERRAVTADVDIGGQTLRQGEGVVTVLHAANRDPRAFEHPDELDLGRSDISHVAFGAGIHQCLGQPVARLILQVALPLLFTAFPTLRLHTPKEELRYSEGRTVWGPIELPVAW